MAKTAEQYKADIKARAEDLAQIRQAMTYLKAAQQKFTRLEAEIALYKYAGKWRGKCRNDLRAAVEASGSIGMSLHGYEKAITTLYDELEKTVGYVKMQIDESNAALQQLKQDVNNPNSKFGD